MLGESGGQGVLSSLPFRWVSFHSVNSPVPWGWGDGSGVCGGAVYGRVYGCAEG